jgi:hypothetical protein
MSMRNWETHCPLDEVQDEKDRLAPCPYEMDGKQNHCNKAMQDFQYCMDNLQQLHPILHLG